MSLYAKLKPGYQKVVVDKNLDLIRRVTTKETQVVGRQVTVSPTGSGKTMMMAAIIEVGLKQPQEANFVWVTHNRQILLQTANETRRALGDGVATVFDIEAGIEKFGSRTLLFNVQTGVSAKKKEWLKRWQKFQEDFSRPLVFIIDEADEGMSGKNMAGIRGALQPDLELGFTASFVKKDDEFEFHRVHYDEVIASEMLVRQIEYQASDEVSRREIMDRAIAQRTYLEKMASGLRKVDRYFVPKMLIQASARDCESVARELQSRLGMSNQDFAKYVVVHTQNSRGLDEIENISEVKYIVGDLMVERGWNCPEAYVLLSTKDSVSERKGIQLLGRVIRLPGCQFFDEEFEMFNRGYVYISGKHSIEESCKNFGDELPTLPPPREVVQVDKRKDLLLPPIITFVDELDKDIEDRDLYPVTESFCDSLEEIRRRCQQAAPSIRRGKLNVMSRSFSPDASELVQSEWNHEQTKKMLIDALSKHIPRNYANLVITKYQIRMRPDGGLASIAPYAKEMSHQIKDSSILRRIAGGLQYINKPYEWPNHKLVLGRPLPLEYERSLYPKMQLNNEEQRFASFLEEACIKHDLNWIRNDTSDVNLFRGHRPDFVVFNDRSYVFIEYKGKHLLSTPDTIKKNAVGQRAAAYFMIFEKPDCPGEFMIKGLSAEADEPFTANTIGIYLKSKAA